MRAILLAVAMTAFAALADGPSRNIDLDRPGALDALRTGNPEHYDRLVVAVASEKALCKNQAIARLAATGPDPCRLRMLMTSYPAKSHLTVRLDDVLYAITLTLDRGDYQLIPAR